MKKIHILVGSMLGGTEYVADMLNDALNDHDVESQLHTEFEEIEDLIGNDTHWIICCSTHGAGDLPDNIQPFADFLQRRPSLHHQRYDVIGIGDSSYDTFNQAAKTLDEEMEQCGGIRTSEPLFVDVQQDPLPEEPALEWLSEWFEHNTVPAESDH